MKYSIAPWGRTAGIIQRLKNAEAEGGKWVFDFVEGSSTVGAAKVELVARTTCQEAWLVSWPAHEFWCSVANSNSCNDDRTHRRTAAQRPAKVHTFRKNSGYTVRKVLILPQMGALKCTHVPLFVIPLQREPGLIKTQMWRNFRRRSSRTLCAS